MSDEILPSKKLLKTVQNTKRHELHVAPDPDPDIITFPRMVELWEWFWSKVPKPEFEVK